MDKPHENHSHSPMSSLKAHIPTVNVNDIYLVTLGLTKQAVN